MSLQIPAINRSYQIRLLPYYENVPLPGGASQIMPAIDIYLSVPGEPSVGIHHHSVILEKFDPTDTEQQAVKFAESILNNAAYRRTLMSVIADKLTDFEPL